MTKLAPKTFNGSFRIALRTMVAALAAFGLFAAPGTIVPVAHAQKSYGVVDVNAIVTSMPEYIAANQKMEAQRKMYTDTIQTMQTQYQTKVETYSKLGDAASPEMKKKETDDLAGLEQQFTKFRDSKFGQDGELAKMQADLMKPITDKLTNLLSSYAKKEHLSMILPKTATIFVDESLDMTAKFQEYLKAQDAKH